MGLSFDRTHQPHVVFEYASRGSLNDILQYKQIPLDDDKILKFAKQISVALSFLHKKNLLHANLKSSNVLVFDDWSVKLADFSYSQ